MNTLLPKIWLGDFDIFDDWKTHWPNLNESYDVVNEIDDLLIYSHHPFTVKCWCSICASVQKVSISWLYGAINNAGSVNPAWTEIAVCLHCQSNSRMRALYSLLTERFSIMSDAKIYIAEQITPFYDVLKKRYPNLSGSEYVGSDFIGGSNATALDQIVRHEDITQLSFNDDSFDVVITQDVFEHVSDYKKAFTECRRVLNKNGYLFFTVPFFHLQTNTEICASQTANGEIRHILEPEYHGNPLSVGSLCFQHFGWDILDHLRNAGFSKATAHMYWGPWNGHYGFPVFCFSACV